MHSSSTNVSGVGSHSGGHGHRMFKLIMGKGHAPNAERIKIQKELFGYHKDVRHGFPSKPTAMAWDPELRLLALTTKHGSLRVYGAPGVEFYGEHEGDVSVIQITFLPGHARLVTLTEDNFLHLWEIKDNALVEKASAHMEGRLRKVSVMCYDPLNKLMLLGTDGGNIYQLDLVKFRINENIIYQDVVMKGAPDDYKVNPGAVEALLIQPGEPSRILIGYARGLIVLWDRTSKVAVQTNVASQQLESLAWRNDGSQFVSSHNDGSFVIWSTQGNVEPLEPPNTTYGPYPCKAIPKIMWAHDNGNSWMVFNGGMPRASYGDKYTVTLMTGDEKHTVFDVTSKVIDFTLTFDKDNSANAPESLIILAEEELIVIDLKDDCWPIHSMPYLNSIHASAITCLAFAHDVKDDVVNRLVQLSPADMKFSSNHWPVNGGSETCTVGQKLKDLLITGHEDGSVKIWNSSGVSLSLVATIRTKKFFVGDDLDEPFEGEDDEEWPPFRKVGHFDPYSDDPRLAVKKISFCTDTGKLIIGGTAGQIVVCDLSDQEVAEFQLNLIKIDLVTEKEGFVWKGHNALTARQNINVDAGYQPSFVVQISPPASINSIAFHNEWGILAAGTPHGLIVVDTLTKISVSNKCTLNAQDIANADDNPMSRRKSLKKSLRESFRRLRKGRSQRNVEKKRQGAPEPVKRDMRLETIRSRRIDARRNRNVELNREKTLVSQSSSSTSKPPTVEKQISYHWRRVQQCTLPSKKRLSLVTVTKPLLVDLTRQANKVESSCQTDYLSNFSVAPAQSLSSSRSFIKIPDWYWTGLPSVPTNLRAPASWNRSTSAISNSFNQVKSSSGFKKVSQSMNDIQASLGTVKKQLRIHKTINKRTDSKSSVSENNLKGQQSSRQKSRFRRASILEQAEARRATLSRNTIKKRVFQDVHRSISGYSFDEDAVLLPRRVLKASESFDVANVRRKSTSRDQVVGAGIVSTTSDLRPSRPQLRLQRSFTIDSFAESKAVSKAAKKLFNLRDAARERKKMEKEWGKTYKGMCNRAAVLNHVIYQADKESMEVKPINTFMESKNDPRLLNYLFTEGKEPRKESSREKFIGLGKQFYQISQEDNSSGDEIEISSCTEMGKEENTLPVLFPVRAKAREIGCGTEDVMMFSKSQPNSSVIRLNLRTRSVEALFKHHLMQGSHFNHGDEFSIGVNTPMYTSKKSIMAEMSPSHIPRLNPEAKESSMDRPDYLAIEIGKQKSVSRTQKTNLDAPLGIIRPKKVDACTQVNLFYPNAPPFFSRSESPESRPVERQIEARSGSEDGMGSMVRCLHFATTYIASPHTTSPTLWAGTNSGQVLIFLLNLPKKTEENKSRKVTLTLGKEIQLKHKAPVIAIEVLDANGIPVKNSTDPAAVPHRVLIVSEEQFKTFLLPNLKPCGKYKLTAHEGAKIRRIGFTTFSNKSGSHSENCLTCLTNQGDLGILSLPELRRQAQTNAVKKEDLIAISTLVFTPRGEAFFMCSSSELQRVSLAAAHFLQPMGTVEIEASRKGHFEIEKNKETSSLADAENKENESQAAKSESLTSKLGAAGGGGGGGPSSPGSGTNDQHNVTAVSEVSADITLDSVRDHTVSTSNLENNSASKTGKSSSEKVQDSRNETNGQEDKNGMVNGDNQVNGLAVNLQATKIGNASAKEVNGSDSAPLTSLDSSGTEPHSLAADSLS